MDLLSFIRTVDPTKVRVGERERDEGEPKLLETTVGRVVSLLPVAPDRSSGDLEASVDKLFDEGGSGEQADQGDSAGGGHGVGVQLVDVSAETIAKDVATAELQRRKKRKTKVVDASEPSHPAKKLRGDYGAPGVPAVGGKSQSAVQRLLTRAVQHAEVRGGAIPTLPFVSSSVSTTRERKGGDYTEFLARAYLRTLEAPQRFIISSDSSNPSGVNIAEVKVDYVVRTYVPITTNATTATPTVDPAAIAKEKIVSSSVFGGDSSFAGKSHPISGHFSDRTGGDFLEKRRLKSVVEEKDSLLKSRCNEIESLKAQLLINEAEATEVVRLRDEAQALKKHKTYLEKEKSELEINVIDLAASVKVREQEVAYLDVVVTSVKLQNDSLVDQGMQDGLATGITHGVEGRVLADVAAYNLFAEADYFSALQCLQNINFSLLAELGSNKDASVDTIMNILRLKDNFVERLGLTESQPCVDQLMVSIHHSLNRVVAGATSLSFALDVSDARVRKIRENIVSQRPALRDVFTPISEPFSAEVLTGIGDDYDIAHTEGREDAVADVEAVADEGADPFPDVSDAELDVSE
uniref:Transposase (Putative), gypsy type n=1 Tax=Tanacetum cinerariifolium TaxID=118510 RepID=A0A6L2NVB6_TANCI|nr:hypothetical protein [Tanacetum cinerariifolium]